MNDLVFPQKRSMNDAEYKLYFSFMWKGLKNNK